MDSVQFIPLIASYLIIIGTVSKLCEIIIKVSDAANYNKVTCKVLNERVQIISGFIELLKRSQLFDKVYRDAFEEYLFTLNSIKRHISNISEIHGFRKYSKAISISERFMVLTKNYESAMKDLQFALIVANEERRKEDIYEGDRFLAEIHSGVFGNYKHLRQIDERVVILADEIKNIRNFLGEENFHGQKGANADILTEQECADADILTEQEGVDADILTEAENYRIFFDEEWIRKKVEEKDINYFEYSEFSNIEIIGEGGFGIVKRAITDGKNRVALKCLIKKSSKINIKDFESLVMELKVLREVSCHKNIISFLGISKDNGYVVVLEYANEGNLREYLTKKFKSLEWEKKIQMALDITSGLNFLHSKGIIHRDLHSKNILVNDGELLIADFGFSERLTEVTSNSTGNKMGVIEYIEPKCFKDKDYVKDKRSDIYSLGVLLWEITSGYSPFRNIEDRDMLGYQISHNNLREDPIEGTPLEYQLLYQECRDDDPAKRPNIDQVYKEIFRLCNVNCTYEQEDSLAVASTSAPNIGGLNSLNNQLDQSDLPDLCLSDNWIGPRNESVIVDINQS
ncbi:kinase-like protein [Rhizophagus irregularis]|nr:kinase-like protein [Rhizophagus irregularis]